MASSPRHVHTFEEYLELEQNAEYKSEFHDGEIYAMAGGTPAHSRISVRIAGLLDARLRGCSVYDSNLNLYIEQMNRGVYPDCMALCGEPLFWNNRRDVILNPTVVVEVLSPSTEDYDRGTKALYYRGVSSIQHILLISQDRVLIDHFSRQDDHTWTITQYSVPANSIRLLEAEIPVAEIYRNILDF